MTRYLRMPPRGRSGPWIVALSVALLLAVQPMWADRVAIGSSILIGLTLVAAARWQLRWLPVVVIVVCAVALRLSVIEREASDVADVTRWAILTATHNSNPYGIGYQISRPPGASFPYGPVALLWYLPFLRDPSFLEFLVSIGLTIYLGIRAAFGRPIGFVIFALAPPLVLAATDGSNDTSAGLFILLAFVIGATRPTIGAAILAIAVAFKPYAIAWVPGFLLWAGTPAVIGFAGASLIAWSPILFHWGVGSYLKSLAMAQATHTREAYWSLAAFLDGFAPGLAPRSLESVRYLLSGAVAILGLRWVRSMDGVIIVGSLAFVIAQFGGYFGSYVYIAAIAPLLCWRLDDWVRMGLPELARTYGDAPLLGGRSTGEPVLAMPGWAATLWERLSNPAGIPVAPQLTGSTPEPQPEPARTTVPPVSRRGGGSRPSRGMSG